MHKIVYLDQNYLSNLAKAQYGLIKEPEVAEFWRELFAALQDAVMTDKIVCPTSCFHSTEAMYNKILEEPIKSVTDKLSLGLEFHPWRNILESQIEDAAKVFIGKQPENIEDWTIVFQSDPQAPVESRIGNVSNSGVRVNVHISLPEEVVESDRRGKEEFLSIGQELIKSYSTKPMDWSKLVLESKRATVDGFMGRLAVLRIFQNTHSNSVLEQLSGYDNYSKLMLLFDRLIKIGIDPNNQDMITKFFESKELLDSPFIDIYSSLWAVIAECHRLQGRDMKGSDFYDVPILSIALPACDVIATDGFMKEITINLLRFNKKYEAQIFSANKKDIAAFQAFIINC